MTEFLGPLCDLVSEVGDTVDVGVVDVASRAQVPKLTELCLRRMRKDDAGVCMGVCGGVHTLLFTSGNGCLDGQKSLRELFFSRPQPTSAASAKLLKCRYACIKCEVM